MAIGPDTVTLVFRDPAPGLDAHGRPNFDERLVVKEKCNFTIYEQAADGEEIIYRAKAALPTDADTLALDPTAALRVDALDYELTVGAERKKHLSGEDSHVRCYAERRTSTARGEQVTIIGFNGRDSHGQRLPADPPVDVIALHVDPGNTAVRYGAAGDVEEADFTVVLPLDAPIKDGDTIIVRGLRAEARVTKELEDWAPRDRLVVLARTRTGGRAT